VIFERSDGFLKDNFPHKYISDLTNPDFWGRTEPEPNLFNLNIESEPKLHKKFKGFKLI